MSRIVLVFPGAQVVIAAVGLIQGRVLVTDRDHPVEVVPDELGLEPLTHGAGVACTSTATVRGTPIFTGSCQGNASTRQMALANARNCDLSERSFVNGTRLPGVKGGLGLDAPGEKTPDPFLVLASPGNREGAKHPANRSRIL